MSAPLFFGRLAEWFWRPRNRTAVKTERPGKNPARLKVTTKSKPAYEKT